MTMRRIFLVGVVTLSAGAGAALIACGSDDAPPAAATGDGGPGTIAPDGSSSPSPTGEGGTTLTEGGGPVGDSGTGPRPADDAGVTADGGIDPPNAGPGGDTANIACGATTCPIPAETCCVSELDNGGDRSFTCVATATCPPVEGNGDIAALKCSSAANCPAGTVCCVAENNGNASSECKATCGNNEAQLCDRSPNADGGGCPASDECSNDNIRDWGNLPNSYATCGGQEP